MGFHRGDTGGFPLERYPRVFIWRASPGGVPRRVYSRWGPVKGVPMRGFAGRIPVQRVHWKGVPRSGCNRGVPWGVPMDVVR
jgi:hypothetical protein